MGKDNQDYFKRAGRSGGPAGPLDHFKSALSQERAMLRRDQEHKLPGERPLTGVRQAGWLHPPQGQQPQGQPGRGPQGQGQQPQARGPGGAPQQARGPGGPTAPQARSAGGSTQPQQQPRGAGGPTPQGAGPKPARPETAQAKPQRTPPAQRNPQPDGLAELESRDQDPPFHDLEPREQEAPYGFGIPASEEAALGQERPPHERFGRPDEPRPQSPWLDARHRTLGERMARRYPEPFRLLGQAAGVIGWFERPVRRALDRMHTLGEIAKRS